MLDFYYFNDVIIDFEHVLFRDGFYVAPSYLRATSAAVYLAYDVVATDEVFINLFAFVDISPKE